MAGFISLFEKQFVPTTERDQMKREFMSLKQEPRSVQVYKNQFNELELFTPLIMADEDENIVVSCMG